MSFLSLISNKAFIHIPKTAGRSITDLLLTSKYEDDLQYKFLNINVSKRLIGMAPLWFYPTKVGLSKLKSLENYYGGHLTRNCFESHLPNNLTYYAVVRNPFSLLASSYFYLQNSRRNAYKNYYADVTNFTDYIYKAANTGFSQIRYIERNGQFKDVNLGRFEELNSFVKRIVNDFETTSLIMPHENKAKTSIEDYSIFYDKKTKKIVEKLFYHDLTALDYTYNDLL